MLLRKKTGEDPRRGARGEGGGSGGSGEGHATLPLEMRTIAALWPRNAGGPLAGLHLRLIKQRRCERKRPGRPVET